ncbi:MAG: hypothetical protein WC119_00855 [Synergistaceae bacterium]
MKLNDYIGKEVDVWAKEGDDFNDFGGTAIGIRNGHLQVRDQEDDVFEVDEDQVDIVE